MPQDICSVSAEDSSKGRMLFQRLLYLTSGLKRFTTHSKESSEERFLSETERKRAREIKQSVSYSS